MAEVNLGSELGRTIMRLERSMLSSWPALSTSYDGDWVIRLANGMTKRSNSVTCLGPDPSDLDRRIDRIEAIFERHRLPPIFRISPLAPPALTDALDKRGWYQFDESIVMTADMARGDQGTVEADIDIEITTEPDAAWLAFCCQTQGSRHADAVTLSLILMLERLIPEAGYGRLEVDNQIAALGLAVVDNELVGLFEVMTAAEQRRKGFSKRLLSQLLHFGKNKGAATAWLAVVADNEPALKLYQSFGFSEIYRYHYCAKR